MSKIIISGASGFVGTNLCNYLLDHAELVTPNRSELNELCVEGFGGADSFVHLAGKAHDIQNVADESEYFEVNFNLTKKLYDEFVRSEAKKFIFISSVKAAADNVTCILTEDVIPQPKTAYGKSKLKAEDYIQSIPLPEGKSYYIIRPCMIHGAGNKGNLNLLYRFVKSGIPYPLGAFTNKRSLLNISNFCFTISELLNRNDIASGVYNLADDLPLSTKEIVGVLSRSINRTPVIWNVPKSIIRGICKMCDVFKLPLNSERLGKLTENFVVSNQKLVTAIGRNMPLSVQAGLEITAASLTRRNNEKD